jgi:hypothetical protein
MVGRMLVDDQTIGTDRRFLQPEAVAAPSFSSVNGNDTEATETSNAEVGRTVQIRSGGPA